MKRCVLVLATCLLSACAGSRMSLIPSEVVTHPVKIIAMAPSGGLLADAIAVELSNHGYRVIDTNQMTQSWPA